MTEDQTLLRDAAERYLRDSYDFNERRERIAGGIYSDPTHWQAFSDMGWLALPIEEDFGGLGLGAREMAILAELCGQFLVTEPLIEAMAVSHAILVNSAQKELLLAQVGQGTMIPVAAIDEAGGAARLSPTTQLTEDHGQWRLTGSKKWISAGASATHLAVLA
ncbi:MAG: acyl-CoA dehydrogenase family protein, partial [Pseudomonadota bacterium]|nr:acyl-CoA dehydrogenase family protein [Pseudomonadota bacterium]